LKKKTKTQRNKEKKKRKLESQRQIQIQKKQFKKQLECLPEILAEIEETSVAKEIQKQEILKHKELENTTKTRKLGRYRFQEDRVPVLTTDKLPKTMRQISVNSVFNPLQERFHNLQKRNIIEVRHKVRHINKRTKVIEKWNMKEE